MPSPPPVTTSYRRSPASEAHDLPTRAYFNVYTGLFSLSVPFLFPLQTSRSRISHPFPCSRELPTGPASSNPTLGGTQIPPTVRGNWLPWALSCAYPTLTCLFVVLPTPISNANSSFLPVRFWSGDFAHWLSLCTVNHPNGRVMKLLGLLHFYQTGDSRRI